MKYYNLAIIPQILLLVLTSIQCYAIRPAYVKPNFETTWMLDINFEELKKENILDLNNNISFLNSDSINLNFVPAEISRLHMYGNGLVKNTSIVLFGNISRSEVEKLIRKRIYKKDAYTRVIDKKEIPSGTQLISKFKISSLQGDGKPTNLYLADVTSGIWIVSHNIKELRRWMDYPYGFRGYKRGSNVTKLLSLSIDVEPTLKNMRKDNLESNYLLQSNIIKQSKEILAVIKRNEDYLYFGTELTANNKDSANQLIEVINSLIGVKNKPSSPSFKSDLLSNISTKSNDKTVTVSTFAQKKRKYQQQN